MSQQRDEQNAPRAQIRNGARQQLNLVGSTYLSDSRSGESSCDQQDEAKWREHRLFCRYLRCFQLYCDLLHSKARFLARPMNRETCRCAPTRSHLAPHDYFSQCFRVSLVPRTSVPFREAWSSLLHEFWHCHTREHDRKATSHRSWGCDPEA